MVCLDNFNGVELAVYDCERTICGCFKYRMIYAKVMNVM